MLCCCHNLIQSISFLVVGAQAYASALYGEGFGHILLDYVQCDGNEVALLDCTHTNHSQCDHSSDAGVNCSIGESALDLNKLRD